MLGLCVWLAPAGIAGGNTTCSSNTNVVPGGSRWQHHVKCSSKPITYPSILPPMYIYLFKYILLCTGFIWRFESIKIINQCKHGNESAHPVYVIFKTRAGLRKLSETIKLQRRPKKKDCQIMLLSEGNGFHLAATTTCTVLNEVDQNEILIQEQIGNQWDSFGLETHTGYLGALCLRS